MFVFLFSLFNKLNLIIEMGSTQSCNRHETMNRVHMKLRQKQLDKQELSDTSFLPGAFLMIAECCIPKLCFYSEMLVFVYTIAVIFLVYGMRCVSVSQY